MRVKPILAAVVIGAIALAGYGVVASRMTEAAIAGFRDDVRAIGRNSPARAYAGEAFDALPAPVRRYMAFTFRAPVPAIATVELEMAGEFRRPLATAFEPMTASQTVAVGVPALMFDATTVVLPGVWARAYDYYAEGGMQMKAKILSAVAVVDEKETPALNQTSLRRWLLESPLYPTALLPGGPVRWEPVDDRRARAVVEADGLRASLVATFRDDGSLERFDAEEDGDLSTPYHGSGEHVLRTDYREAAGMMIPHGFVIARAAGGDLFPFWRGRVTAISFQPATPGARM
ncbi:hypothetical protein C882_0403 [Caenispirillum salinarum AK4]|uniref:Uncharacterized protein n=1 Tax=Caenispirillum salinarum AK4 TaxID=1238182 RepID=K9HM10_9PROT|nr:DUF6544 family protein [Caenispirillum salinarum]EKV29581.1 hypothetical protein C882_0403 [Caenispirillum salinarum AK4]